MKAQVIRSAFGRFCQKEADKPFQKGIPTLKNHVSIYPDVAYQTHIGFGGAITESTAYTLLEEMPKFAYREVIKAYFSPRGLRYNLARLHMNSCDFSLENYTYVKTPSKDLKDFDISREDRWVIPFVQDAMSLCPDLKVLISPWSPPAFMKDNHDMNHGGHLLPEYSEAWAHYYTLFIQELEKRGVRVWALTVQNEPAAVQTWDSCIYSAEEERDFVKNYLGPELHNHDLSYVKIMIWDHNLDILLERALPVYRDDAASAYVWGTGFHWYVAEMPENLNKLHTLYPDKHLMFTEGCIEGGPRPGVWSSGERYARNIINDFNNYCEGFFDWNLVLNEQGGPNHVGNYCDAPILADRKSKKLIYNSSFYFIRHFSRYIAPGAHRVGHTATLSEGVRLVTYLNPDGTLIVVVQNETDRAEEITICLKEKRIADVLPSHSIVTYVVEDVKK